MNKVIDIIVLPKSAAKLYTCEVPWAAISISSDETQFANLSTNNRKGLLQLCFLDRDFKHKDNFQNTHASQIIEFVFEMLPKIDSLLIHCEAGVSRSSAIAAAISEILWGQKASSVYFTNYTPNNFVYRKILDVYFNSTIEDQMKDNAK